MIVFIVLALLVHAMLADRELALARGFIGAAQGGWLCGPCRLAVLLDLLVRLGSHFCLLLGMELLSRKRAARSLVPWARLSIGFRECAGRGRHQSAILASKRRRKCYPPKRHRG